MSHFTELFIACITGGIIPTIFAYFKFKRSNERVDFELILKTLSDDNVQLRKERLDINENIRVLEKDVLGLRNQIILLESAHMDLPIPMWLKDTKGIMLALNASYEQTFLIPNGKTTSDYIGKTDIDVWGQEIGTQYWKHDQQVLRTGRKFDGKEIVEVDGEKTEYRVIKYARFAGRTKIGIAGLAIPPESR